MAPEKTPFAIEVTCNKIPETGKALLRNPQAKQFIDEYNRRHRKADPNHIDVTPARILEDAEVAREIFDIFLHEAEIQGGTGDVEQLIQSARRVLGIIESQDVERILEEQELKDRFEALGINLDLVRKSGEKIMKKRGVLSLLRKAGILGAKEKYSLPFPEISEGDMQDLEAAFELGILDTVIIDDARLNLEETIEVFAPQAGLSPKNIAKLARPLDEDILKAATSREELEEARREAKASERKVQLVAFRRPQEQKEAYTRPDKKAFLSDLPRNGLTPLELGTYLRLNEYLQQADEEAWGAFRWKEYYEAGVSVAGIPRSSLVNNVLPDGRVVMVSHPNVSFGSTKEQMMIEAVNPEKGEDDGGANTIRTGLYVG